MNTADESIDGRVAAVVRVAIVEDDPMLLSLLERALRREDDLVWVGSASTPVEARAMFAAQRPELVLLDLRLGGVAGTTEGWSLVEGWLADLPAPRWIVVTGQPEAGHLRRALDLGLHGYVTKQEPFEQLLAAIREVAEGRQYYSAGALRLLMDQPPAAPGLAQLTPRERDVLRAVGEGLSVRQTSARLAVSENTVKTHRLSVMRKLDLHDAVAMARYAIAAGLAAGSS